MERLKVGVHVTGMVITALDHEIWQNSHTVVSLTEQQQVPCNLCG